MEVTAPKHRRFKQHIAIHGSLVLLLIGEVFALDAQLKQLNFGGPLTPRNIEGRAQMMWIAIAFVVLTVIVGAIGRSVWIAVTLLVHAIAMLLWFNTGWGYTVLPTVLACLVLWVVWMVRSRRHPDAPVT